MSKDWLFKSDEYTCDLRAAGVLVHGEKLLVQREADGNEYALPGGHVKIGETTSDSLIREYKEETGADITVERLLWTEECFWSHNGRQVHNITFYYLINLADDSDLPDTGGFLPHKDNSGVVYGWMPVKKLNDIIIYPEFIRNTIHDLSAPPRHFVTKA